MKCYYLSSSLFHNQKCLLPDSDFLKKNFGKFCFVDVGMGAWVLARISLCEIKNLKDAFCLDDSVYKYSSPVAGPMARRCLDEITFRNFKLLTRPGIASKVKAVVVFSDISQVGKFKNPRYRAELQSILVDILKMYTLCVNAVLSLKNLSRSQSCAIKCLLITSIANENQHEIFRIDSKTEIEIEECTTEMKLERPEMKPPLVEIGGCNNILSQLTQVVGIANVTLPGVRCSKKILLAGPSGCGKSTLVQALAYKCSCILLQISACDIIASNKSEINGQEIIHRASSCAESGQNCIIHIKNIDIIIGTNKFYSKKLLGQFVKLLEDVENKKGIVVIATTNSLDSVNRQLRTSKRFEHEFEIKVPNNKERGDILQKMFELCKISCGKSTINQFSQWTPGFVAADLKAALVETLLAIYKIQGTLTGISDRLLEKYFKISLKKVIPSELRKALGLCKSNDAKFVKIGGLENIKKLLNLLIKQQLEEPEKFNKLGIPLTKGLLLYGPPGCAKTSLVKALARECQTTFLATSAADLYSPYVGDAEKKIVQLFAQARIGAPSIIFIDEIDAIVGSRSGDRENGVQERILSCLLTEMDGIGIRFKTHCDNYSQGSQGKGAHVLEWSASDGVIIIGATNQPQLIDDALKRPGRFDRLIYIPPPGSSERLDILKQLTANMPLHKSVNLEQIAEITNFYSGADLKSLCYESGLYALTCTDLTADCIQQCHFQHILNQLKPSLNDKIIQFYESL